MKNETYTIEDIDELLLHFTEATDEFSKEVRRSLLMEKKGRMMGRSPQQTAILGSLDGEKSYGPDAGPYDELDNFN